MAFMFSFWLYRLDGLTKTEPELKVMRGSFVVGQNYFV